MAVGRRIAAGGLVAGYEVGALVGRGGMGEVYRALDLRLERPVALKLLSERLSDDEGFRDRMLRESRLAASLDHPNVVPIYEAGEADGRLFIAMRYVDGTDLKALLRLEGALSPARVVAIAAQVANALDAAHAKGLVHRDVKPSNVLLDQQGGREHAYLADFGLTQSAGDARPTDGQLMGTVDYVAPEQIRGDPVDGRADVYALGCLLFETLTGTVPFQGASEVTVLYAHLEDEPPRASERRPELPPDVDAVLSRAMAKEPDARQQTCALLVDEARRALRLETRRRSRRGAAIAAIAGVSALAAAITAAALVVRADDPVVSGPTGGVVRIDAASRTASAPIRLGDFPVALAAGRGIVWVAATRDGALWKVNGTTNGSQRLAPNGSPRDVAIRGGAVYVASDGPILGTGTVSQYELVSGFPRGSVDALACSLTAGAIGVWIAGCPNVVELRPGAETLRTGRTVPIPPAPDATAATYRVCLCGMASGLGSVWVIGDWADPRLWRIDPGSGKIAATFELPFRPQAVAAGAGGVWVADFVDDRVARVDPRTGSVRASIPVGRGPVSVEVGTDAVWVANRLDRTVSRIDPESLRVTDTIDVGLRPVDVAVDRGDVWVAVEGKGT